MGFHKIRDFRAVFCVCFVCRFASSCPQRYDQWSRNELPSIRKVFDLLLPPSPSRYRLSSAFVVCSIKHSRFPKVIERGSRGQSAADSRQYVHLSTRTRPSVHTHPSVRPVRTSGPVRTRPSTRPSRPHPSAPAQVVRSVRTRPHPPFGTNALHWHEQAI